jgi:ADP-ribosylation factor GTPase-activating protein 2/3
LDEWTQRQIDAMRLGGNDNARKFFRKNGVDMHFKIDKKYTIKAAQLYRQELEKLVNAEAAKRGEGIKSSASSESTVTAASLLDNLSLAEQQQDEEQAKERLAQARSQATPSVVLASAKTAAELHGKGKLLTPPNSGNAPKIVLRAPTNISKNLLKKKPSSSSMMGSKLRVNKIATSLAEVEVDASFEDVQETQMAAAAEPEPVILEQLADQQQQPDARLTEPAMDEQPSAAVKDNLQHQNSMEAGVAKLQQMNTDFFSGF